MANYTGALEGGISMLSDPNATQSGGSQSVGDGATADTERSYSGLFYTSKKYVRIDEYENKLADDVKFSDLDRDEIFALINPDPRGGLVGEAKIELEDAYFNGFCDSIRSFHLKDKRLKDVFEAMADHFKNGKEFNTAPDYVKEFDSKINPELCEYHGHDYSNDEEFAWRTWRKDFVNPLLTNAVFEHETTKIFVQGLRRSIHELLVKDLKVGLNGNIDKLGTGGKFNAEIIVPILRDKDKNGISHKPDFSTAKDTIYGLKILVNDVWAWRIEFQSLSVNISERKYRGFFYLTMFDHFGLDKDDMEKAFFKRGKFKIIPFSNCAQFIYWFVLQRYKGLFERYRPFVTRFTCGFSIPDSDEYPGKEWMEFDDTVEKEGKEWLKKKEKRMKLNETIDKE